MDFKFVKSAKLAGVFTAAAVGVGFAFQKIFGQGINALFSVSYPAAIPSPVAPISTTVGSKIAATILQYIPGSITVPNVVLLFISAMVAIMLGNLILGFGAPSIKGKVGKIASTILYGTIPLYLLVVGTAIPTMSTVIGVLLYTAVASYLTALVAGWAKIDVD